MKPVIVFDVIETLLDLAPLDRHFRRAFGDKVSRQLWFRQMLEVAMTMAITGTYEDFSKVGKAALKMTAMQRGTTISAADRKAIMSELRQLPPHDDVRGALESLHAAGFRIAALTNSTEKVLQAQLKAAGIHRLFDKCLSVDAVRRFKPSPEAYAYAARQLRVTEAGMMLVAAHTWDVSGAMAAGCRAAFVKRPGKALSPLGKQPEIVVSDLRELARKVSRL